MEPKKAKSAIKLKKPKSALVVAGETSLDVSAEGKPLSDEAVSETKAETIDTIRPEVSAEISVDKSVAVSETVDSETKPTVSDVSTAKIDVGLSSDDKIIEVQTETDTKLTKSKTKPKPIITEHPDESVSFMRD